MTTVPVWAWAATFGALAVLVAADLVLTSHSGADPAASDVSAGHET